MNSNKEVRSLDFEDAEVRAVKDSRTVEGYAILFNKESKLIEGRFTEIIKPEAIRGVIEKSDVLATLNHDVRRGVLARSTNGEGSLKLTVDNKGVKYRFDAPNTALGDELLEGLRRGDIRSSSFGFSLAHGGAKQERRSDGSVLRTITQFDNICDVSAVYNPVYADASVALRSIDEQFKDEIVIADEIEAAPLPAKTEIEMPVEVRSEVSVKDLTRGLAQKNRNKLYKQTTILT